jgi:hypothetical protein
VASHDIPNGSDNVALLRALNDVVRSTDLATWGCLELIVASLEDANGEIRCVPLRNRQILEVVFEPIIRKFEYASVI